MKSRMDVRYKTAVGVIGASAVTGLAAWLLLQSRRAPAAPARHAGPVGRALPGSAGNEAVRRDGTLRAGERRACGADAAGVPQRGPVSVLAHLLSLILAFLHAFLRTDWLKFIGSPSVTAGMFLVVPAAWLVIRENFLVAMGSHGGSAAEGEAWTRRAQDRRAAGGGRAGAVQLQGC